jgi:hypothetical protein
VHYSFKEFLVDPVIMHWTMYKSSWRFPGFSYLSCSDEGSTGLFPRTSRIYRVKYYSKAKKTIYLTYLIPSLFTNVNNFPLACEALKIFTLLLIILLILARNGISKFYKIRFLDKNIGPLFLFVLQFGIFYVSDMLQFLVLYRATKFREFHFM